MIVIVVVCKYKATVAAFFSEYCSLKESLLSNSIDDKIEEL